MRKALMLAASLAFLGAVAANAQQAPTPQPSSPPPAATPDPAPTIKRFNVVDVSELSPDAQKQVQQVIAQSNTENLQQLRKSIDAVPEATAALKAKGATSAQVVATSLDDQGTLTLITKKNS
jgi:hypothetical protein